MTADIVTFPPPRDPREPDGCVMTRPLPDTQVASISSGAVSPELLTLAAAYRRASREFEEIPEEAEKTAPDLYKAIEARVWPAWQAVAEFPVRSIADIATIAELGLRVYAGSDGTPFAGYLIKALARLAPPQQNGRLLKRLPRFLE